MSFNRKALDEINKILKDPTAKIVSICNDMVQINSATKRCTVTNNGKVTWL